MDTNALRIDCSTPRAHSLVDRGRSNRLAQ